MCNANWHLTGKSVTTIGSELVNLQQGKLDKCIFVCTKGSLPEVYNDYNKFYNFRPFELSSSDALFEFFNSDRTIAVTRYEWLKYFDKDFLEMHVKGQRIGMWWDEAQKLKNGSRDIKQIQGTKTHMTAKMIRPYCSAFHLVTATPVMTKLDDLWSLMHLVDPTVFESFQRYCHNFYEQRLTPHPKYRRRRMDCPTCGCRLIYSNGLDICSNSACRSIQSPQGYLPYRRSVKSIWELIEYKNLDMLSQMMQPYMFCFYPEQDVNYIEHRFDLDYDVELQYEAIAKDMIEKEDEEDDTPFATRLIQLQYLVDSSYNKRAELWKLANKIKDKGFVLYVPFYESLSNVEEVLKTVDNLQYKTYSGKDSDSDRDDNKAWFQKDPVNKCLIITAAGGASLNLQVTNQLVFYGLPNGFGAMSQAMGRVIRLFSAFKTFDIHFILAEHTVDVYKYTCFLMYQDIMQKLMNNKLINLSKPISFNNDMKAEMRKDYCWRQE